MAKHLNLEIGDLVEYDYKTAVDERYAFYGDYGIIMEIIETNNFNKLYRVQWTKGKSLSIDPLLFSRFQLRLVAKGEQPGDD